MALATRRSMGALTDVISPCRSSNRKPLTNHRRRLPHHPHCPTGGYWSASTTDHDDDEFSRVSRSGRTSRSTNCDTEMLLLMGTKRDSSHGSCAAWSMGSLLEKRPTTPSPICSPARSSAAAPNTASSPESEIYYSHVSTDVFSSAPRNQSSSAVADCKKSASPAEVEVNRRENAILDNNNSRSSKSQMGRSSSSELSALQRELRHMKGHTNSRLSLARRTAEREDDCNKREVNNTSKQNPKAINSSPMPKSNGNLSGGRNVGYDRRLSAVKEVEEEGCRKWSHSHNATHRSRSRFRTDDGNSGGSDDDGSRYGNSGIEGLIEDHLRPAQLRRISGFESKLLRWKEASTLRLMNKLKKKEAEIGAWEQKKAAKAKMEMKEFEMKLEKKRDAAMQKLTRKILGAQREAAKKKAKARTSAVKKMNKVAEAYDRIETTGKLPWKLVLL